MPQNKYITFLISVSLFVLFFSYYYFTSSALPKGAGPDWKSNTEATNFIYENGRIAVLPDDEKELHFTVYGGTRALRPPLSYIVSAATAGFFSFSEPDSHLLFRKGSALLSALAVALTFFALNMYFLSYRVGILGAVIIALMPQFTFIASYNNDDSGAIFSAALMIAVLVRIYRYGINNTNAVLIGLAGGLVIISKMTAWLLLPFVALFLAIFVRANSRQILRYSIIAGAFFMLTGGWWLASNMVNYGINDPIAKNISTTSAAEHRRLPPDAGVGFSAQGIGYYDLLVKNYKGFYGATARSTIGNLDWLKLKVGPLQYAFYLAIFYIAIFYYFFSLLRFSICKISQVNIQNSVHRRFIFESILVAIIFFQLLMYTWTNIYNDIQLQGKYLIPVFMAVLILFFSAVINLSNITSSYLRRQNKFSSILDSLTTGKTVIFLTGLLVLLSVHWNAWQYYVIPFYQPPPHNIKVGNFTKIAVNNDFYQRLHNIKAEITADGIQFTATGADPQVILRDDICRTISPDAMLKAEIYADNADTLQFFIDEGTGFSSRYSVTASYKQGNNSFLLPISALSCKRIRFDPFTKSGPIVLKSLQIAPISIRERR